MIASEGDTYALLGWLLLALLALLFLLVLPTQARP